MACSCLLPSIEERAVGVRQRSISERAYAVRTHTYLSGTSKPWNTQAWPRFEGMFEWIQSKLNAR